MGRTDWFWFIITLSSSILSISCCVWLACGLRWNIAGDGPRKLFPRQLLSFAVGAVIFNLAATPVLLAEYYGLEFTAIASDLGCNITYFFFRFGRNVVLTQDMHIAITFLAQTYRMHRVLQVLNRGIPVVWLIALVLVVLDAFFWKWVPNDAPGSGHECHAEKGTDWLSVVWITLSMGVWSVSSVVVLIRSSRRQVPGSVQVKNFKRGVTYPLVAFISYFLICIDYLVPALSSGLFDDAATFMEISNGWLVTLVYVLQSRRARAEFPALAGGGGGGMGQGNTAKFASFHAEIGGVDVIHLHAQSYSTGATLSSQMTQTPQQSYSS